MKAIKNQSDVSGVLGEKVSVRKVRGKVEFLNRPKLKRGDPSAKQQEVLRQFKKASTYARQMTGEDGDEKTMYEARITNKLTSAYSVAMNDYLNSPIVEKIDTVAYHGIIGDEVLVNAFDDFSVTRVIVTITSAAGVFLESGDAVFVPEKDKVDLWKYTSTVANPALTGTKIQAVAYDRPGNSAKLEVIL